MEHPPFFRLVLWLEQDVNAHLHIAASVYLRVHNCERGGCGGKGARRGGELMPVEYIEGIETGLEYNPLPDGKVLQHRHSGVLCRVGAEQILREGPEVIAAGLIGITACGVELIGTERRGC